MKKLMIGLSMVLALALVANVAFTDEDVIFPFWQHGWAIMSFWSISNDGTLDSTVTVNMLATDGSLHFSTTAVVAPGTAWQLTTAEAWYTAPDGVGFGNYQIVGTEDAVYLWGAVFALLADSQPGYTIILPGNPYGM